MLDHKPLILIAEADLGALTSLYAALDGLSYLVATRRSEVDTLKYAAEHKPDLVIFGSVGSGVGDQALFQKLQVLSPGTQTLVLDRSGHDGLGSAEGILAWPSARRQILQSVERLLENVHS